MRASNDKGDNKFEKSEEILQVCKALNIDPT